MSNSLDEDLFWEPCEGLPKSKGHGEYGFCQAGTSAALDKVWTYKLLLLFLIIMEISAGNTYICVFFVAVALGLCLAIMRSNMAASVLGKRNEISCCSSDGSFVVITQSLPRIVRYVNARRQFTIRARAPTLSRCSIERPAHDRASDAVFPASDRPMAEARSTRHSRSPFFLGFFSSSRG